MTHWIAADSAGDKIRRRAERRRMRVEHRKRSWEETLKPALQAFGAIAGFVFVAALIGGGSFSFALGITAMVVVVFALAGLLFGG